MEKRLILIIFLFVLGCKNENYKTSDERFFNHAFFIKNKPWTHSNFDTKEEKFTFALFSDLTGGERKGVFDVAIAQLNLLRPELIINVGDLIEGDHKNLEELNNQWSTFDGRVKKAIAPVFYVGGNHDLTDKKMSEVWEERYGKTYYHFIYKQSFL